MEEFDEVHINSSNKLNKNPGGSFQTLGLDKDLLKGVLTLGYKNPTPVQRKCLPVALTGVDIVCMARTGSGKTLAFLIPMIQKLRQHESTGVRALILSPTRELATQTLRVAKDLAKFTTIRIISIVGGDGIESQFESLADNPDAIIASPGRLAHHLSEISTFKLKSVSYIVFDEADRLFEMGFADQINQIMKQCPIERQTLLFSATMPKMLLQFSRAGLRDPQLIRLDTDVKMSEELRLVFLSMRTHEKLSSLLYLVRYIIPNDQSTIVFTATKHHSEFIYHLLCHIGVKCSLIYGSMEQEARQSNLRLFRTGEVNYLIVTDLAARGIDIPLINNVINYHFPPTPKLFVHRCGRAARQGRIGFAFSLVEPEELPYCVDVHRFLDLSINTGKASVVEDTNSQVFGSYTLSTMQPSQVHMGLLPQDALDEETEYLKTLLNENELISAAAQVASNAMKQYRRTRPSASHSGVKEAKTLVKQESITLIHPLIQGMDPKRCDQLVVEKANYIRMLQTFRPSLTVLETGIGTGSASGVRKKRSNAGDGKDHGMDVMKALRTMNRDHLERNRAKLSVMDVDDVVDENSMDKDHDDDSVDDIADEFFENEEESVMNQIDECNNSVMSSNSASLGRSKLRLSIAEKRKLKKKGCTIDEIQDYLQQKASVNSERNSFISESKPKDGYKDPKYYMNYGTEDQRATYAEQSLQPKADLRPSETQSANMLENALLDLTATNDELLESKNKKITHWDEKKRKFVKQTLSEMAESGRKGKKRLRSELGVSASSKKPKGELYEKWKKKSHREIGLTNESDDHYANRPKPNVHYNTNIKDEIRNKDQLRKLHKQREKNRLKNMSKEKRNHLRKKMKNTNKNNNDNQKKKFKRN